jgi:hypothetical protein
VIALPLLLLHAVSGAALSGPTFDAPAEPDPVLAEQRGGFRLPNGLDIALAVQTQTSVNGAIVLRTEFQVDQGPATTTVYAPRPGQVVVAQGGAGATATGTVGAPTITFDNRSGLQVTPGAGALPVSVSGTATSASGGSAVPAGLAVVSPGAAAATDNGQITQSVQNGVRSVQLNGADLTVTHLTGNAFGSAIANSGSDRAIDTQTSVSIDIHNASPDALGSAMFRVQDIALDATAMRAQ